MFFVNREQLNTYLESGSSASISYKTVELYGGAITVSVPANFEDVSTIRDVPDNQEVYLSKTGLANVIFDIVERAEPPDHPACTTDLEALKYHFNDIVNSGYGIGSRAAEMEEETKVWGTAEAVFEQMPGKPACTMFATQHAINIQGGSLRNRPGRPDFTAILLTLLRLPEQKTDILISINVPHVRGESGYDPQEVDLPAFRHGPLIDEAMQFKKEVLKSFRINDWGLFVTGEEEEDEE